MPKNFDLTKQYIEIPNFYTYTEKWCDKNIREVHDLDLICKTRNAEYELCRFLEEIGANIHIRIKEFNRRVKSLTQDKLEKMYKKDGTSIFYLLEDFRADFCLYYHHLSFDNEDLIEDLEGFLSDYHAELAPVIFKKAANDVIEMAKKALKPIGETLNFLEELEEELDRKREEDDYYDEEDDDDLDEEDDENDDDELDDEIWEPDVIEMTHVKVRDGFVYVLSHELMPNIYKVGFTSRSPDERAAELSYKSGLPKSYKVEKYWRTNDPYIVEQRIHNALAEFAEGREHFQGDLKKICAVIDAFIKTSNQDP